ncbi:MAG: GNAT family N-acetyltransferase [Chloroflexi bacterium]|nr:GNAT family N-acetyltransferase [Chloroflexota bacterium]
MPMPVASPSPYCAVPASGYPFQALADIYNQTRIDYIVPMPMNARRMELYVSTYDIDLGASIIALDTDGDPAGIGMLGLRGDRAWLTRLGVLPCKRGHQLGRFMMESLLEQAARRSARQAQLEVIKGNAPAHRLFLKFGFEETRELLVIRRPPGQPAMDNPLPDATVSALQPADIAACLEQRPPGASWIDETPSLLHAGSLQGLRLELPSGDSGWVVYQNTAFQIAYIVLHVAPTDGETMARALLYHLHRLHPLQDTKVENLPALDAHWPAFQSTGYVEAFRRIEMRMTL